MAALSGNVYKGNDRNILKGMRKMILAMQARDTYLDALIADVGRKSSRVSNRSRMIPAVEPTPATGITTALATTLARINVLLAQVW